MDSLFLFVGATVLLALSPGPDLLFVIAQASSHGRRTGSLIAFGLCSGLVGHTALVALGVGAWLVQSATAMLTLRLLGGTYLLYLAWQAWVASRTADTILPATGATQTAFSLYRKGVFMNLSNPKVSLFFLAFLPQFVEPARGNPSTQIAFLGAVFALTALVVFNVVAALAARLSAATGSSTRRQRWIHRLSTGLFVGLAVRIFVT